MLLCTLLFVSCSRYHSANNLASLCVRTPVRLCCMQELERQMATLSKREAELAKRSAATDEKEAALRTREAAAEAKRQELDRREEAAKVAEKKVWGGTRGGWKAGEMVVKGAAGVAACFLRHGPVAFELGETQQVMLVSCWVGLLRDSGSMRPSL